MVDVGQLFFPHARPSPASRLRVLSEAQESGWVLARSPVLDKAASFIQRMTSSLILVLEREVQGVSSCSAGAFHHPLLITIEETDCVQRTVPGFRTRGNLASVPPLSCHTNLISDPISLLSTPISLGLGTLALPGLSLMTPRLPSPSPAHLPPTHLVLFLAQAFSFLNMAMSFSGRRGDRAEEPWPSGKVAGEGLWEPRARWRRRGGLGPPGAVLASEGYPLSCQSQRHI